ncbi:MAG: SUF system NifU family Fe-S cluster assembly protein [Alphaproteobacteria bacterium]|nr:SUF system NifU family Fe-S cluster assembly protein [Alphaproteobacteria bacterium]
MTPNDDIRDLYQDVILDHSKHPRNFRAIEKANHTAVGHNPLCGDQLTLYMEMDENSLIKDVSFKGSGCAISTASASMMTEMLKGKTETEAKRLFDYFHAICTNNPSASETGLSEDDTDHLKAIAGVKDYPMRVKCATLAWHTLIAAIKNETKVTTE